MLSVRYVFAQVWPRTVFVVVVGWLLFVMMEGMESARYLARGTWQQIAELYALRAPEIILQMVAPGVVLGTLAGVGLLNRRAELAALAAGGRSLTQVALPAVLALCCCAVGLRVVLTELVMPATTYRAVTLGNDVFGMRGPRYWTFYWRDEWFRAGPLFARAQPAAGDSYNKVMAVTLDGQHRIRERVVAVRMTPLDRSRFELEDAHVTRLGAAPAYEHHDRRAVPMPTAAAALSAPLGYPDQYSTAGLTRAIERREAGGRDATAYRVALLRRFVDPLMLVCLGVLALAIAARQRREAPVERQLFLGGMAVAATQGLVVGCDFLATKDWLPTWVVGALAPGLTAAVTLWMWRRVERAKHAR